jgi:hypothetical protein
MRFSSVYSCYIHTDLVFFDFVVRITFIEEWSIKIHVLVLIYTNSIVVLSNNRYLTISNCDLFVAEVRWRRCLLWHDTYFHGWEVDVTFKKNSREHAEARIRIT